MIIIINNFISELKTLLNLSNKEKDNEENKEKDKHNKKKIIENSKSNEENYEKNLSRFYFYLC